MIKKQYQQKGQAMMEYIIITCLVGIFCLVGFSQYGSALRTRLDDAKSKIVETIRLR